MGEAGNANTVEVMALFRCGSKTYQAERRWEFRYIDDVPAVLAGPSLVYPGLRTGFEPALYPPLDFPVFMPMPMPFGNPLLSLPVLPTSFQPPAMP